MAALASRKHSTSTSRGPADWTRPPIPDEPAPVLTELQRVIPIAASQTRQELTITLLSLECYAEGLLLRGRFTPKYGQIGPGNVFLFHPIIEARDDAGTAYRCWPKGRDRERFSSVLAPALPPEARELRLEVTEARWTFFQQQRHLRDVGPWSFTVDVGRSATWGS